MSRLESLPGNTQCLFFRAVCTSPTRRHACATVPVAPTPDSLYARACEPLLSQVQHIPYSERIRYGLMSTPTSAVVTYPVWVWEGDVGWVLGSGVVWRWDGAKEM